MNEKQFSNDLKIKKSVIIYGAGMVGNLVYSRLCAHGLKEYIIGFAVSSKNMENHLSLPIYEISELVKYKELADIVIATLPNSHKEIFNTLRKYGFQHIWKVTEVLYQEMAQNYIEEFKKMHIFKKSSVDVLLMSSDNNSSSGAFLCLTDLSVELSKAGISNVVVLPEYGNGEGILLSKNIDYVYISSIPWVEKIDRALCPLNDEEVKQERNNKAILELEDFIVQHKVKLVHNNSSYTYVGAAAAKKQNIPFIWHIRENIYEQGFAFVNYEKSMDFINQSAKIFAVSKFISKCYQKLEDDKIQICYDGVKIEDYYNEKKQLLKKEKILITQIGSIAPVKNQRELIEMAFILKKKKVNFEIRIVGNGDEYYIEELKRAIKEYCLEKEIIFVGRRDNVRLFYQESDIIAVCSKAEAFGRTTVEAQLAGCLIIGADIGATSELIEDGKTGFLYKAGDAQDFAEKVIYALNKKEISEKVAANGQRYAYGFYTKERNAKEIIDLYKEILSGQTRDEA